MVLFLGRPQKRSGLIRYGGGKDMESSLLVQKVYLLMYVSVTRNAMLENWASLVRKLLCSIGCNEVWLQQGVSNRHSFLRQCKQRLCDFYIQNWSIDKVNIKLFTL